MKKVLFLILGLFICSEIFANDQIGLNFTHRTNNSDTLSIAVVGDIMMGTTYPSERLPRNEGQFLFKETKSITQKVDIALGNLEGTLCDQGETTKEGPNSYAFKTPTYYGYWLKDAGFDFMSMANNHANDFGIEGIESTERSLDRFQIAYAGLKGRKEWTIIQRKGIKIGICAFGHNPYTVQHLDTTEVKRVLDSLKKYSDIIIVSIHGGAEGSGKDRLPYENEIFLEENRGNLRLITHFCIDNGADLIYCHGPHVVRCVEVYNKRFIAYSLGNFCTPYGMSLKGKLGFAPIIEIKINSNGEFIKGKIYPFVQFHGTGPREESRNIIIPYIKKLSELDVPFSEGIVLYNGDIVLK